MADMKRCEIPPSLDATNSPFLKHSVDVDNGQIVLGSKLTPTAQVPPPPRLMWELKMSGIAVSWCGDLLVMRNLEKQSGST